MIKFEKVSRFSNVDIQEPIRKTNSSACYDMVAAEDVVIMPMSRLTSDLGSIIANRKIDDRVQVF